MKIDSEFLEKLIIKSIFELKNDKNFNLLIFRNFESKFFKDKLISKIFKTSKEYYEQYKDVPSEQIILNTINNNDIVDLYNEIKSIDFDCLKNYDFLLDQSNEYLKKRALTFAILESADIINEEKKGEIQEIQKIIIDAINKDLKINLGLDYFGTLKERIARKLSMQNRPIEEFKVPTYYPRLDEFINGGFPPYTLEVFLGITHIGKSSVMANLSRRQVIHGFNVGMITMEMSEDMYSERYDAGFANVDINKMYIDKEISKRLIKELSHVKNLENRGDLYIKEFSTGKASVADYRIYIRELELRGVKLNILYVDYINLMKPSYGNVKDMYLDIKHISEELRALGNEFNIPIVSATQINRGGCNVNLDDLHSGFVSESFGLPATTDFIAILGIDYDKLIYENELMYKIEKNRLGGRVGEIGKLYNDTKSLNLYDETELQLWLDSADVSGDTRQPSSRR